MTWIMILMLTSLSQPTNNPSSVAVATFADQASCQAAGNTVMTAQRHVTVVWVCAPSVTQAGAVPATSP